jgi:hypothetical protein
MVRVKFLSRHHPDDWARYFPDGTGRWGGSQFIFERDALDYDWLVVHDDVPPGPGQRRGEAHERLRCPRQQTLLLTTEPESIKTYGRGFCAQFGAVITSQPAWALPHPQRHYQHAGNLWFYGLGAQSRLSRQALLAGPAADGKHDALSVVHSPKRMRHTAHAKRHALIEQLRAALPAMRVYGRNAEPLDDKAQALAPFRYHLAVENHIAPHHITEKLTDALLGRCLCFYAGAPNAAEYFPAESFIPIDIHNPARALATIRSAMADRLWEARREVIEEARQRVLEREHLFAIIDRVTGTAANADAPVTAAEAVLHGRHAWRRAHPLAAAAYLGEKLAVRLRCRASASSR